MANHWCDLPFFTSDPPDTRITTLILAALVTTLVRKMLFPSIRWVNLPLQMTDENRSQGVAGPPCEFPNLCPPRDETGGPHCLREKDLRCKLWWQRWMSVWVRRGRPGLATDGPEESLAGQVEIREYRRQSWEVGNDRRLDDATPLRCMWLEVWRREKKKRTTWREGSEAALNVPARLPRSLQ